MFPNPFELTLDILLTWQPTIDGVEIPDQILKVVNNGSYTKVPIMLGTNHNEGVEFVYPSVDFLDNIEYVLAVLAIFRTSAPKVLEQYPIINNPFTDMRPNFSELITHYIFGMFSKSFINLFFFSF